MKKLIIVFAALICASSLGFAQQMQDLPNDPATKVGKLDNGLTYYIRHNEKPSNRAEFYLATDAGAVLEEPDQDGLAHFLEHMCFNGTKNFPGKGILNWLESIGASFGGNVNASTGIEQTIYMLNNIPLSRPGVVDTCILIMHDYSHFVLCEPSEIDAERGVIIEEKRSRNTADWRNFMEEKKYIYKGTPYETVSLIGAQEQLENFKPESLVNFYHRWYRPDNQALIVVGDVNVDEVEAKIKSIFADIPAPETPLDKPRYAVPDNQEPIVGIITDPETTNSTIEVYWKSEANPEQLNSTPVGLMTDLLKDIIATVMNERFSDIAAKPDAPFMAAQFQIANLIETTDGAVAAVSDADDKILTAFEAMFTETEKMHRYGFTDAEIERAKTEILSQYETLANRADTRQNSQFINPIISNFFDNYSFMDPAMKFQVVQSIMPQLSPAVINQVAQALITRENMVICYLGPKKDGLVNPTEQQLLDIVTKVQNAEIAQAAGEEIPTAFLDASKLKGSKVKKTSAYLYDSEMLTLANGLSVVLLPTDHEKDRISISLYKKGGKSLIETEDLASFDENVWSLYLSNTGLADFPMTTVTKMLAGKQVSAAPFINGYTHGISASSTAKDLETAFQLLYLNFTKPRFDADEFNQGIKQIQAVLPNLMSQSNYKLNDELYKTVYNSPRRQMINEDIVARANVSTLERVYRQLFNDVAGATAFIVGDFKKDDILPLVQKYLGSLPKGKKASQWSYRNDGFVDGKAVNDFRAKMEAPKVTVYNILKANKPYSVEAEVAYNALSYILDIIYTETMREEEGGTYGASSGVLLGMEPYQCRVLQVAFETNEDQAERLRELALKGIKDLAEKGPDAEKFDKALKNAEKNIPENKIRNAYWMNGLQTFNFYGIEYINNYESAVKALTPEKVKAAAAELIESGNLIEIVMRPEK